MKNFLSMMAEKWQIVSESNVVTEANYSKVEEALQKSTVTPSVYVDLNLDDVEDF